MDADAQIREEYNIWKNNTHLLYVFHFLIYTVLSQLDMIW